MWKLLTAPRDSIRETLHTALGKLLESLAAPIQMLERGLLDYTVGLLLKMFAMLEN